MSVVQTVLLYVVPPVGVCIVIALLVSRPKMVRRPRYRVGQPWRVAPMWWTVNPEDAGLPPTHAELPPASAAVDGRGGARGTW